MALIAALLLYIIAMPIAGYVISTLPFFIAVFWVMGMRRKIVILASSVTLTAIFWAAFTMLSDLPLPQGQLRLF